MEGSSWAGALYLGEHGAVAGARFGPWGAAIGGLGGSMLGGMLGRKLSEGIVNPPNPVYVPMKWDNLPARPDNLTVKKYIPNVPFK